ncbi:MAG: hypothetical protein Q9165_008483 [Trypethelium subeluteriae]
MIARLPSYAQIFGATYVFLNLLPSAIALSCIPNPAYTIPSLLSSNPLLDPLRSALDSAFHELLHHDELARKVDYEEAYGGEVSPAQEGRGYGPEMAERIKSGSKGGGPPLFANITSFSIAVTTKEELVYEFHHSAQVQGRAGSDVAMEENLSSREQDILGSRRPEKKIVDGNTAYRIASCTKVFTVLALLLEKDVNWDDPVTKWLPELRGPDSSLANAKHGFESGLEELEEEERLINHVHWESITLRSLASQLSGIARQYGVFDLLWSAPEKWQGRLEELGFPPVEDEDDVPRSDGRGNKSISRACFLEGLKWQYPIFASDYQSTYSNTGFVLLGMVLEKMTGREYTDVIAERITQRLGLNRTTFTKPHDKDGVIPAVPNDWDWDIGIKNPTGGLYSTAYDTATLLRSIMRSDLLTQEATNKWLHVQSESPGLYSFYGMPWEITRTAHATSDGRAVTMFTKGGDLGGYHSRLSIIPEFGVGASVLVAGRPEALPTLLETVDNVLLKGMDDLLRRWTETMYTGTFVARGKINSSLELGIAETGGLEIKRWISNGTDFLDAIVKVSEYPPLESNSTMEGRQARMFPTGLKRTQKKTEQSKAVGEVWRVKLLAIENEDSAAGSGFCLGDVDEGAYAGRAINEMVLFRGEDGRLEKVTIPVLKIELERKKKWLEWVEGTRNLVGL